MANLSLGLVPPPAGNRAAFGGLSIYTCAVSTPEKVRGMCFKMACTNFRFFGFSVFFFVFFCVFLCFFVFFYVFFFCGFLSCRVS